VKILQISAYAPPNYGGSESFCLELSKRLVKKGHNVDILASSHPMKKYSQTNIDGVNIYRHKSYGNILGTNPLSIIYDTLEERISEYDVVHVHSYIFFLSNQVALLRKKQEFPYILHLHGGLGHLNSKQFGIIKSKVKDVYDLTLGKWTIQSADWIFSCNKTDSKYIQEKYGIKSNKITTLPNPINFTNFHLSKHNPPIVISYIGRLTASKGAKELPQIASAIHKEIPEAKFRIIGDGPFFPWITEKMGQYAQVYGRISHDRIPEILQDTHILILPSHMEGMPLVVLEALASGVPVVAYDVGGVSEIVINDKTGFTVNVGKVDDLVQKTLLLIKNHQKRLEMGLNGRKIIEKNHSWEKVVEEIVSRYTKLSS